MPSQRVGDVELVCVSVCVRLCVHASNLFCLAGYIDIVCYSAGSSVCLSACQGS